jgi:hypothetical protein
MVSVLAGHGNHLSTPLKYVETPRPRSSCFICPSQVNSAPPLDPSSLPDHILAPCWLPLRPLKGLNSIHLTTPLTFSSLWTAIPSAIGPATWHYPTSLFLLLWTAHPTAIGLIPSLSSLIPDWPTQYTGLLYNHVPFVLGSLIPDDGGSTYLWNVGQQLFYTAVHPRRWFWTKNYQGFRNIQANLYEFSLLGTYVQTNFQIIAKFQIIEFRINKVLL